mmetsp:Transcript_46592/g.117154  ORF Transcript_46592/g.117154 Transcript_46592/m.117154 type:complete len:987 (-) Transcript_46592:64-3024(-)
MGQNHSSGTYFHEASVKDHFNSIQALWSDEDLANLIERLKEMTLNFSLDKAKFARLLQLSVAFDDLVSQWFTDFSHDRASQVVDGLEFLSAVIMVSSKVSLFRKICLLFVLFDLDKTGCIRKDEFTIFLKAVTTGVHRIVNGVPPPATVMELGGLSSEFFATLSNQVLYQQDLLMWMTEAQFSLHYLSVFSRLGCATFAFGTNHRYQLGLEMEPRLQRVPAPVLRLEGIRIASVASNESHCLFRTEEGAVWSCGSGFCGILGHGDVQDCRQPRQIEALAHAKIIDVAVGVRHSVAISDKGQVFTWGAADMGQLGHGGVEDREVHEWAYDPKSGGTFAYVVKPTVVMGLFGQRINARRAACCNFSTAVLTDQGHIYTWGNNTDGQCGQGQKCPDHRLIYVDPHMQRTAMQALLVPRKLATNNTFIKLAAGGYHMLAIDSYSRVWSWGRGLWGPLGHGDQRSMYDPKMIDTLKYQVTADVVAGEAHSVCLSSLYRMTITGSSQDVALSPFSLLGLPVGRVDLANSVRQPVTPPNTTLQLSAFASAKLMQVALPWRHDPEVPVVNPAEYPPAEIQESIVLMDRGLWEGEWLKLETTDFDFNVKMSPLGAKLPVRTGVTAQIMYAVEGKWEASTDCAGKLCVFECPAQAAEKTAPEDLSPVIVDLAVKCQQGQGYACIFILPKNVELFSVEAGPASAPEGLALQQIPFGVMTYEHGAVLKKHITRLINMRIAEAPEGVPEDVQDWQECREDFTGRIFYENVATGEKRWAPPQINPNTHGTLLTVQEDSFLQRLQAMLELNPKGIIVCQQSWKPDVELVQLAEPVLEQLTVPVVLVTYEAGEELKSVVSNGSYPWITLEVQPYGGVCAWGNGTYGQLGLAGIENQSHLTKAQNVLTSETNLFANRPIYVAHLHEHQVTSVACGTAHTLAVTQQGEVFSWGAAEALGISLEQRMSEVPTFVEPLEGLVRATKAFAGHYHSFVLGELPFRSIV